MIHKANHQFTFGKIAVATAALLVLSGCATGSSDAAPGGTDAAATDAATIDNCGFSLATSPAPEKVVTIKSTPLELMLALGLEDHIVGSAFLDGPVAEELAPEGWEPNVLAEDLPSQEVLISASPDFVFAGWESNLSTDGVGTREDLLSKGMRTYVAPPACEFGSEITEPLAFGDVFQMITEVGSIFEVEDRAEALIAEQQTRLDAVATPTANVTALWYSSGSDTPFVGGGTGTPHMIMTAAGLENVASSELQSWYGMPWETFVASDPDVIVLVDAPWNSAEEKRERLESHPAASKMTAVQEGNYIIVDFATTEAGVRNVEAVETIANELAELPVTP